MVHAEKFLSLNIQRKCKLFKCVIMTADQLPSLEFNQNGLGKTELKVYLCDHELTFRGVKAVFSLAKGTLHIRNFTALVLCFESLQCD